MGNLRGESREQNRKDKVTTFRSVTYARATLIVLRPFWVIGCLGCRSVAKSSYLFIYFSSIL